MFYILKCFQNYSNFLIFSIKIIKYLKCFTNFSKFSKILKNSVKMLYHLKMLLKCFYALKNVI